MKTQASKNTAKPADGIAVNETDAENAKTHAAVEAPQQLQSANVTGKEDPHVGFENEALQAPAEVDVEGSTQKKYDETKVNVEKRLNNAGEVIGYDFTATQTVRKGIPLDSHRVDTLNAQAHNTGVYYFPAGKTSASTL